jgi:hypothetical protein
MEFNAYRIQSTQDLNRIPSLAFDTLSGFIVHPLWNTRFGRSVLFCIANNSHAIHHKPLDSRSLMHAVLNNVFSPFQGKNIYMH